MSVYMFKANGYLETFISKTIYELPIQPSVTTVAKKSIDLDPPYKGDLLANSINCRLLQSPQRKFPAATPPINHYSSNSSLKDKTHPFISLRDCITYRPRWFGDTTLTVCSGTNRMCHIVICRFPTVRPIWIRDWFVGRYHTPKSFTVFRKLVLKRSSLRLAHTRNSALRCSCISCTTQSHHPVGPQQHLSYLPSTTTMSELLARCNRTHTAPHKLSGRFRATVFRGVSRYNKRGVLEHSFLKFFLGRCQPKSAEATANEYPVNYSSIHQMAQIMPTQTYRDAAASMSPDVGFRKRD
ncbi:hypothetical protein CLF_107206 [Clonorchis sinensis]|uniref:Uncharacterized protein n=1 Tax=Clonorchis sinensis TaxID=79923 RepID=G7YQH9_CLOSI|nr:hypothetical protein CLF_107206 [Clonorchis sinensis]